MKRTLPILLTLPLMLTLATSQPVANAQTADYVRIDDSEQDDDAPVGRVARLSFMQGDVSFLRAGVTEWAPAVENLPLLAGDQIFAARGGRAEIQLGRGSYIRLSENTELTIAQLSDSAVQFEVTEGTALVRLERVGSAFGRFEIDTPNSALVLIKDGLYRIEVGGEKQSELIVRNGEAEVSTDEGSFRVREGHRLMVDTATGGRLELAVDTSRDDWDQWSYERDATIASTGADITPDDVTSYETTYSDFYGASDLSSYGTWTNYSSYGRCWIPRVGADWAPYRLGQWIWIPAAGWTWLSSEPWGWAPYHYGRWSYLSGLGWAWIPGFGTYSGYGYRDYRWRPALVYFFNWSAPSRNYVGWQPLGPGERWRRPDTHRRDDGHAHLRYPTPRDGRRRPNDGEFVIQPARSGRGITILPVEGFTRGDRTGARPAAPGREHSGWIEKGTRAGLPEIKPAPDAIAPVLGENDRRRERRVAAPPAEVITRPVVTRNADADAATRSGSSRERRLISPPSREMRGPALIVDHSERGADRRSKPSNGSDPSDSSSRLRLPLPASPSNADDGSTKADRRNRENGSNSEETRSRDRGDKRTGSRDVEISLPRPEQPRSESREQLRQERRQETERQEQARPENREKVRQERRQETERQEQARPENREQVRQERRQEQRQETPRSENRGQARQERHQEKEQRQQPQEQRRKP
ncbi:MAG TPA: DUF6600 domain-containing protein [Blastocatellia bacterium]|nr:DUF6600 domain-containing protein [Blastocatellia bacterium]